MKKLHTNTKKVLLINNRKMYFKTSLLCTFFFTLCFAGCKKWDDHTKLASQDLGKNLLEEISQRSNLSKFVEYLKKSGLDKELASSKTYTVFAPVNDALQNIDPAVAADSARLRVFIGNHISLQSHFTGSAVQAVRVAMLNGKRVTLFNNKFDEANITERDKYVSNGVLHVIDKAAPVYQNAWELVENTKTSFQQSAFISSLTRKVFDPTNAIIDSINSQTGQPIYRPGTDSILQNSFNTKVYDLANEGKEYTFFILNNASFNSELAKMNPYFKTSTADSTKDLAGFALVKDLIVEGKYSIDQLPPVLTSQFGVKIPIDKNQIVETRRLSNGVAYVINTINFDAKDKIPAAVVQGENYLGFFTSTGTQLTPRNSNNALAYLTRHRVNPNNGERFTDLYVVGHGTSALAVQYSLNNLPSGKYKVYWVAVNDTVVVNLTAAPIPPANFSQRLAMGVRGANFLPTTPATGIVVAPNNYNEVYVGDYTHAAYGKLDLFLTANGTSPLTLDYIKLVPDL